MGNALITQCGSIRVKEVGKCIECEIELADENICDVCLKKEMEYLDNLKYIHSFGN